MPSFLELLGWGQTSADELGETPTVRKIVRSLESLPADRARFLAAFAYLLSRVAHADLDISEEESREMESIVQRFGHLPEAEAVLAVQIAKSQSRLFGGTEDFKVTRELKKLSERKERHELLHCLFAVAAADGEISPQEEEQIRRIANELGLSHREMADVRSSYNAHRSVLQRKSTDDAT